MKWNDNIINEVKNEVKIEVKNEVKIEVKNEVKNEVFWNEGRVVFLYFVEKINFLVFSWSDLSSPIKVWLMPLTRL